MHARRSGDTWFLHFQEGQLHEAYREFARKEGVKAGVITAGIGMLKDPQLGFFDGKEYHKKRFAGEFELVSTQGNLGVLDGEPFTHLHVSIAGRDHLAHAGHLFEGAVHVAHEASLRVLDVPLRRERETGSPLASLRW
jgi:hypothetical protein